MAMSMSWSQRRPAALQNEAVVAGKIAPRVTAVAKRVAVGVPSSGETEDRSVKGMVTDGSVFSQW